MLLMQFEVGVVGVSSPYYYEPPKVCELGEEGTGNIAVLGEGPGCLVEDGEEDEGSEEQPDEFLGEHGCGHESCFSL